MLIEVPRGVVHATGLSSELLLGEADTIITALVGADGPLTSNALVVSEASAFASLSIANTLVCALNYGVGVVCVINISNPGLVLGAGSAGAIRASPLHLTVDAVVASAFIISAAASVARAAVGTVSRNGCNEAK